MGAPVLAGYQSVDRGAEALSQIIRAAIRRRRPETGKSSGNAQEILSNRQNPSDPGHRLEFEANSLLSKQGISSRITGNVSVAFTEFSHPKHGTQIGGAERRHRLQPQTLVRLEGAQLENEVAQQA